jgi:hypothetical protein
MKCTLPVYTIGEPRKMKNITLSANEEDIEAARRKARSEDTTLNAEFRKWLHKYGRTDEDHVKRALAVIDELSKKYSIDRKYTRDEMNERR